MTIRLTPPANEESTYAVEASFFDETGVALTPTALTWTLTDRTGAVINSRSAVVIAPASTVTIVLSGEDLSNSANGNARYLLLAATYDSNLGTDLPLRESITFTVDNLVGVS